MNATRILIVLTAALLVGCVQRTISITSNPAGALVHLNDEEVGRTPLQVPFKFYGTYDVRLEKERYKPLWTSQKTDAPWWEAPGPDLIVEAPYPFHFGRPKVRLSEDRRQAWLSLSIGGGAPAKSLDGTSLTLTLTDRFDAIESRIVAGAGG